MQLNDIMAITDQDQANKVLAELIEARQKEYPQDTKEEASIHVRTCLGYHAGYFTDDVRIRVEKLFNCVHPILGKCGEAPKRTPEEIFATGMALGQVRSQTGKLQHLYNQPPHREPEEKVVRRLDI